MKNRAVNRNKCTFYRVLFTSWRYVVVTACAITTYIGFKSRSKPPNIQVEDISTLSSLSQKSRAGARKRGFCFSHPRFWVRQGGCPLLHLTWHCSLKNGDILREALSCILFMSAFLFKSPFLGQKPRDIESAVLGQKQGCF